MKKKHLFKGLLVACALFATTSLTGCNTFFGGSDYLIDDVTTKVDDKGNTIVTISFGDNTVPDVVFSIPKGIDGNGIKDVKSEYDEVGLRVKITIIFTDPTIEDYVFYIPVMKGEKGAGIGQVKVETLENGDQVLTFTYTDGREDTVITIPKGQEGNGIKEISIKEDEEGNVIATITFTDLDMPPVVFTIPKGDKGNGITLIEASERGDKYILTIYYDNGMSDTIEFDKPTTNEWLYGNGDPSNEIGKVGDFYFNTFTGDVFLKINDGTPNGRWKFQIRLGAGSNEGGDKQQYVVTYNFMGGEPVNPNDTVADKVYEGECIKLPLAKKDGYKFIGWYTDEVIGPNTGHFTDSTPVTQDWTLYAHYELI